MIVDAILTLLLAPVGWLLSLIPTVTWPSWLTTDLPSKGHDVGAWMGQLNGWVPMDALLNCVPLVAAAWGVLVVVKMLRLLVSVLTGGGGAN